MAGVEMNWKEMAEKRQAISIAIDDLGKPQMKHGVIIGYNDTHLFIQTQGHEEGILLSRILRVELRTGEVGR